MTKRGSLRVMGIASAILAFAVPAKIAGHSVAVRAPHAGAIAEFMARAEAAMGIEMPRFDMMPVACADANCGDEVRRYDCDPCTSTECRYTGNYSTQCSSGYRDPYSQCWGCGYSFTHPCGAPDDI